MWACVQHDTAMMILFLRLELISFSIRNVLMMDSCLHNLDYKCNTNIKNNRSRIGDTCTIQEQCFFICSGIPKKPLLCMSRWQKSTHTHQSDRTPMCQLPGECFSPGPTHRRLSEDSQLFIIIPDSFSPQQLSVSNISCCPWNHQTDI